MLGAATASGMEGRRFEVGIEGLGWGGFGTETHHEEDASRRILLLKVVRRLQEVSKNEHRSVEETESSAAEILCWTAIIPRQRGQAQLIRSDSFWRTDRTSGVMPNSRWQRFSNCVR